MVFLFSTSPTSSPKPDIFNVGFGCCCLEIEVSVTQVGFVFAMQWGWPWTSNHSACKCFDYRTGPPCRVLWVPKDQTKDFVCAKQTFYQLSYSPSPWVCCVICWFVFDPRSHIIVNDGLLYSQTTLKSWQSYIILPRAQRLRLQECTTMINCFLFFLKVSTAIGVYIQGWWLSVSTLLLAHQLFPLPFSLSLPPDWLWVSLSTLLFNVIATFLVAKMKHLTSIILREEGFILAYGSRRYSPSWQQEQEEANHMASQWRK